MRGIHSRFCTTCRRATGRGERGIACLPGRESEFREGVEQGIDYALALGCRPLNCLAGIARADAPAAEIRATFMANLRHRAQRLAANGIGLLSETINSRLGIPGFWLGTPAKALALLDELAEPNLWLQCDIYHAQMVEGDLPCTMDAHVGRIAHFHVADNPGRHEPGTSEINYPLPLRLLARLGYRGWLGCKYRPSRPDTESSLGRARDGLVSQRNEPVSQKMQQLKTDRHIFLVNLALQRLYLVHQVPVLRLVNVESGVMGQAHQTLFEQEVGPSLFCETVEYFA